MRKATGLFIVFMSIAFNTGLSESLEKDNLRSLIEEFEGIKLRAYRCPKGIPTIGIGSTRYEDGKKVKLGDEISLEHAEVLYEREIESFMPGDIVLENYKSHPSINAPLSN